ncbi:MAG: YbaK/EbsC family protein [Nitrososphaerota archaeon]|nr:YbaK/EbsC family protein [Nitrososphaerota archaeon]MDG7010753.1 YbaK/EbsC family protein [Nitrososphaerota archaeon]
MAEYLSKSGVKYEIREFDESTKNSALAARALGCSVPEIAKSVVFVGDRTAVVVTSGDRRVSVPKLSRMVGDARIARPDEVREKTGFPIGGVPPFPHDSSVAVLTDISLTRFRSVWASAGAPNAVFRMDPSDMIRLVGSGPFDLSD